jgi:transcriptional regulator with XRE-family HTH domain
MATENRVTKERRAVRNAPIAAAIRAGMKAKGMQPRDLCEAMGLPRDYANIYHWIHGMAAPKSPFREKLAAALDIPPERLIPAAGNGAAAPAPVAPAAPQAAPDAFVPKLHVSFTTGGRIRIQCDALLSPDTGRALLHLLTDPGAGLFSPRVERF